MRISTQVNKYTIKTLYSNCHKSFKTLIINEDDEILLLEKYISTQYYEPTMDHAARAHLKACWCAARFQERGKHHERQFKI